MPAIAAQRSAAGVASIRSPRRAAQAASPSHSARRFNTRFFLADGSYVFGDPAVSEELEDVRWHPIGHEQLESFRDVTRFMLSRALALRGGTASGGAPLFYWAKNARRIGVCREAETAG